VDDLGLFEVNEAAQVIHEVAHPEANIIFGAVIDDELGDEVRITVIAAGFERWDESKGPRRTSGTTSGSERSGSESSETSITDVFADGDEDELFGGDDDFDVPSFLK
jgi:cell division protein FtsZ